ncbi:hypothetical protein [Pyrolobus fumarii]|uniref:hypothetical protein n=1 Tax=Pyrolobus fumarii TaxID=54252 RepID=UPI00064F88C9|nr:hypothetical protein [Pyrolobus fumarii]
MHHATRLSATFLPPLLLVLLVMISFTAEAKVEFNVDSYTWKSRVGGDKVYPGSRGVTLTVTVYYMGNETLEDVTGCLLLPPGVTPSTGSSSCAPALRPDGTPYLQVQPGDVIVFVFRLDISKSVEPGWVGTPLYIRYYSLDTGEPGTSNLFGISIYVSPYPTPSLRVEDVYWEPVGYPGTQGATLNLVLLNTGESSIESGTAILELDPNAFRPAVHRVTLPAVASGGRIHLRVTSISISPGADPGLYKARLEANVTAATEDGVEYQARIELELSIPVAEPPPINLTMLDYGFEGLVAPGSRGARLYATLLQNQPGVTVQAIVARLQLEGATLANGSTTAVLAETLHLPYGATTTILLEPLTINDSVVRVRLVVDALVSEGGSEYWARLGYNLTIELRPPPLDIRVLNVTWVGGRAYPGSQGLTLRVTLANMDYRSLEGITATLVLPLGFHPERLTVTIPALQPGSTTTLEFRGVSIEPNLQPGLYAARLSLRGLVSTSGSYTTFNTSLAILVRLDGFNANLFRVESAGWETGIAYNGSRGVTLTATLTPMHPGARIEALYATIVLPPGIHRNNLTSVNVTLGGPYSYGEPISIRLDRLSIEGSVSGSVPVALVLKALVSLGEAETWHEETHVILLPVSAPRLEVRILDYSWATIASGNASGARLRILLQSLSEARVTQLVIHYRVLTGGFFIGSGREVTQTVTLSLEYGQAASIETPPLVLKSGSLELLLTLEARLELDGMVYTARARQSIRVEAPPPPGDLQPTSIEILYGGAPARIAPGAEGIVLRVRLLNTRPDAIASVAATLEAPEGFTVEGSGGTCLGGVGPGSQCTLEFVLRVSPLVEPGSYNASIRLVYTVVEGGALAIHERLVRLVLPVVPLEEVAPRLRVLSVHWGTSPTIVYPEAGVTQLAVTIVNLGRWEASGVTVTVSTSAANITVLNPSVVCAATLPPGSSCTAVFRVRVGEAKPGWVPLRLTIAQLVRTYGVNAVLKESVETRVWLGEPPWSGVVVVDAGWLNDWPVYPNTSRAEYRVTIANLNPYPLAGVLATLEAPHGMRAGVAYAPGPIQPYSVAVLDIPVDVGSVKPGVYNATLVIEYMLAVEGVEWRHVKRVPVKLEVHSVEEALTLVTLYWEGGSPEPGTIGATLNLILRNNEVPEMTGVVVRLILPPGIRASVGNASVAAVPAGTPLPSIPAAPEAATQLDQQQVAKLLEALRAAQTGGVATNVYPRGSFIAARVALNLYEARVGEHPVTVEVEFIDAWGSRHVYRVPTRIVVHGSARLVDIETPPVVNVTGGWARVELRVVNIGSGPVYNAYLYIVPRVPLLLPNRTVYYLGTLQPHQPVAIETSMYYNPAGLTYWTGSDQRYASVPFTFVVVYRDVTGTLHMVNLTKPVQLLPFIDIRLGADTRAEQRGSTLTVGGTIVNQGTATARSVEVIVEAGGARSSSFIGDMSPGDQAAFRIDLVVEGRPESAKLTVVYRDDYGRLYEKSYELRVYHHPVATGTATPRPSLEERVVQSIAVIAPLAALTASLVLYALYKRRGRAP